MKTPNTQIVVPTPASITERYDYITINFPNGKFTISRSGFKCSGDIPQNVFRDLIKYFESSEYFESNKAGTYAKSIEALFADGKIEVIYPGWKTKITHDFKQGDTVAMSHNKRIHTGIIQKINKTTATTKFASIGLVDVPLGMLQKMA